MRVEFNPTRDKWEELVRRPELDIEYLDGLVDSVVGMVREKGDEAIFKYAEQFDKVKLQYLFVAEETIKNAADQLEPQLKEAIKLARNNIEVFHRSQEVTHAKIATMPGVTCWRKSLPIEKVGLYIPGGSAPLFSTLLMLAVPASVAGCSEVVVCTPPSADGTIHPAILYTASICGIDKIYAVGGIQAIAAMAYGTETIPKVYKIFGPGNQYVTHAKRYVANHGSAIDMPAGPSELLVIADSSNPPSFTASDLLSQAEHGADSQVVLVTDNKDYLEEVKAEIRAQLELLPRKEMARQALNNSTLICFDDLKQGVEFSNHYAPEHLIIACEQAEQLAEQVTNAGSVFIGNWSPESIGDYASGTNHSLPTHGYARVSAGVSLDSFLKKVTFQQLTSDGIRALGPSVEKMALAEELQAHKNAVSIRLQYLDNEQSV
jgi:histidinol dehydrogenase